MGKLEGKIALITSINDAIGLAAAKRFVNEGAYVFIAGRRAPELIAAIESLGSNVTDAHVDVSNLVISIVCSHRSSRKRAGSTLFFRTPVLRKRTITRSWTLM